MNRRELLVAGGALFAAAAMPKPQVRSGYARVPMGRVWWQRYYGMGDATPLLTLHGGPGAAHYYLKPLRLLADRRDVILYDQLGCGRSDIPKGDAPYHIARYVEEVDAVRASLGLDRVILYGHSWGAVLAIEYMVTGHGNGVEALILGGAMASMRQFVAGTRRLIAAMPNGDGKRLLHLEDNGPRSGAQYERLVNEFYALHLYRGKPNADVNASGASLATSPAYAVMNGPNEFTVTGNLKNWDRRGELGSIRVPTLVITSQYDEVSLDCHETIHHGIRGSGLVVLPNCSHLAMQEAPVTYNRALRDFLLG